jgi:hypothetical protein
MRRTPTSLSKGIHDEKTESELQAIPRLPITAKIPVGDTLTLYCTWVNLLLKQGFATAQIQISGRNFVIKEIFKHDEKYIKIVYFGYDGGLFDWYDEKKSIISISFGG